MNGKTIVITGASAGIGAALATLCESKGANVVPVARSLPIAADMTKRADVERVRDVAIERFGKVDVWVNNVGRGIARPILALTDEDVDEMIAVNVKSALYGMQAIVPHFQARGDGHVINVSSVLGRLPLAPIRSAYGAAKAALDMLTAILRTQLAQSHPNIHVSLIVPGVVATDFGKHARGGSPDFKLPDGVPFQTADEVAAVIAEVIEHPVAERFTQTR
ncbi:MAG TPA: SDR family NAD(P)-dependent oxidoreductase [Kofleriaceae bacterium]|nr:SDR family NAD(P)-dependent oxidoreductase [Kofleriaceae bacterium]